MTEIGLDTALPNLLYYPYTPNERHNMIDEPYTCEDCDKEFEHEDDGYMSEAGFECHECHDKRMDAEYADFIAWKAEPAQQIARNYPELAANVKRMEADPVGFYFACKNPGAGR